MPLITGAVISFTDGTTGIVDSKLGEGGQGEVYLIKHQGVSRALKWYKERPSLAFVALCVPPAVDPLGHVIPLACDEPLYVFALGLLGHVNIVLLNHI